MNTTEKELANDSEKEAGALEADESAKKRRRERPRLLNAVASSPSIDFTVLELSPSGMSVETEHPLQAGDVYELRIRHKQSIIEAEGTVRWCRLHEVRNEKEAEGGKPEYLYRAGFALRPTGKDATLVGEGSLRRAISMPPRPAGLTDEKLEAARRVVDRRLLEVVYQPIFDLKAGKVFGYEALARYPDPLFAHLPDLFEAAAHIGKVGELGRQHRIQAVSMAPPKALFVNVSPWEFDHGWLIRPDDAMLKHPQKVYLEITESVPISRFEQCRNVLSELRKKGIGVVIDDLGAGFSNLRYLADLAPELVKIDRNLISGVNANPRSYALLEAVVAMCKRLNTRVIAEGIETREELVAVDQAGVELCQGYLLGRPALPASEDSWPAFL